MLIKLKYLKIMIICKILKISNLDIIIADNITHYNGIVTYYRERHNLLELDLTTYANQELFF